MGIEILRFIKILLQSTKNKEQSSISHTPEGTNTATDGLSVTADVAIVEAQAASISRTDLCRRPVAAAGECVPLSSAAVSWID
jgi:hypothetical protein